MFRASPEVAVPTARYEWERIVRRVVMPASEKLLALVLATYADPDGSRVRPGIDVLVAVTGQSRATIKRNLSALRNLDLLGIVRRGGGRAGSGKTTEYRLTIPVDLLDRVEMVAADEKSFQDSGSVVHHADPLSNGSSPVSPHLPKTIRVEGSLVSPQKTKVVQIEGSLAYLLKSIEGSFWPNEGSWVSPYQDTTTIHPGPTLWLLPKASSDRARDRELTTNRVDDKINCEPANQPNRKTPQGIESTPDQPLIDSEYDRITGNPFRNNLNRPDSPSFRRFVGDPPKNCRVAS